MAVGDDTMEEFASSLGSNSIKLGQVTSMVSPEDVAWADSCLTKDAEEFDKGWNSMKEALLETLDPQHHPSAHLEDQFSKSSKMEISSSNDETHNKGNSMKVDVQSMASTNQLTNEMNDDFWSRYNAKDIFLPTYDESLRDLGTSDPDMDLFIPVFQLQTPTEDDIFKIWDLDVPPVEDDELIKQLNTAVAETPLEAKTSIPDHSKALKGSGHESVDDLISGIADLSLKPDLA